jgi:hypothetical protein
MDSKEYHDSLFGNLLLRREAGEGWHSRGLHSDVLGALATREEILDAIAANGGHQASDELHWLLRQQYEVISALKDEHGIGDPPPRFLTEDTPGASE